MSTRSRTRSAAREDARDAFEEELPLEPLYDLDDDVTDEDIEAYLDGQEEAARKPGFWNLPTAAGLATIAVGSGYLLQEMGVPTGFDFSLLAEMLPWLAGVLIILIGFGVLSWSPNRRKRRRKARHAAARRQARQSRNRSERRVRSGPARSGSRTRLTKSRRHRKIAGVAGGIADHFGIDPTLVRIAFVLAAIFGQGLGVILYLILAWVLPKPTADNGGLAQEMERAAEDLERAARDVKRVSTRVRIVRD